MAYVRLLVEMDALLDTRVGVIDRMDPEAAVRLVSNPAYYTRQIDQFEPLCGIDEERYQAAWKARSVEDLKHASVTPIIDMLNFQLLDLERKYTLDPTLEGTELVVNLYPYRLSQAEEVAVGKAILRSVAQRTPVRFIFESPDKLTPELIRPQYSGLIFYNHHVWMQRHAESLTRMGIPQVTLVAPKLFHERIPTEEECHLDIDKPMDIWEFTSIMATEAVGVEFLDVAQYCTALGLAALGHRHTTETAA